MIRLRDYQAEDVRCIESGFDSGLRSILYILPTGCGKTTVFCSLVENCVAKGMYVNIIVHRIELIDQIHQRLASFGIDAGIIAGKSKGDISKKVQVSSVQTLSKRNAPPADIVIIDEAHHALASTYTRLWREYPVAKILGVTATPIRLDGEGFENHFQKMINNRPLAWYFNNGYLVKPIHHVCSTIDSKNIPLKNGDYDFEVLSGLVMGKHKADVLDAYKKLASGKKAVIFCQNIEHSKATAELFNNEGIPAAHLDGDTPDIDRKRTIRHFRSGRILVLTNVDIVSEGFDIPDIECVILGALTKSLARYKQQVGRALRLADGKSHGLILDCVGMWLEHQSMAIDDYEWTLEGDPKIKRQIDLNSTPTEDEEDDEDEGKEKTEKSNERNLLTGTDLTAEDLSEVPILAQTSSGKIIPMTANEALTVDLQLIPIGENLRRLVVFEAFLVKAQKTAHKPLWAVYEYQRYLKRQHRGLTDAEMEYCKDRLNSLGIPVKEGFWFYLKEVQMEFQFEG